jgi:hypothetical protein
MSPQFKQEYFEVLHKRHKAASFKEKTAIIDECCIVNRHACLLIFL